MPADAHRSWTRLPAALALTALLASLLASSPASAQNGRTAGPFPVEVAPSQVHVIRVPLEITVGADFNSVSIGTIPPGKRFVVELLTAFARVPPGQSIRLILTTDPSGSSHFAFIPLSFEGTFFGSDALHAYLPGRFYIDAGAPALQLLALRGATTGDAPIGLTLSGYLVDLPPATP